MSDPSQSVLAISGRQSAANVLLNRAELLEREAEGLRALAEVVAEMKGPAEAVLHDIVWGYIRSRG